MMSNLFDKYYSGILLLLAKTGNKCFVYRHAKVSSKSIKNDEQLKKLIEMLEPLSLKGDGKSSFILYKILTKNSVNAINLLGLENFNKLVFHHLLQAAHKNIAEAQYFFGMAYLRGDYDIDVSVDLAHDWLTKSARLLYPKAFYHLGVMYFSGIITGNNHRLGMQFLQNSHELGCLDAKIYLANIYIKGVNIHKNLELAYKLFLDAAMKESAEAAYHVAQCLERGKGTKKNLKHSFYWYNKAYQLGFKKSAIKLADFYISSSVVKSNPIKAENLLLSLASLGNVEAQFKLALFYDTTKSNLQNQKKAFQWYVKAANQGCSKSQINLAAMALRDECSANAIETARFWMEMAAKTGNHIAQYNLKQLQLKEIDDFLADSFGSEKVVH